MNEYQKTTHLASLCLRLPEGCVLSSFKYRYTPGDVPGIICLCKCVSPERLKSACKKKDKYLFIYAVGYKGQTDSHIRKVQNKLHLLKSLSLFITWYTEHYVHTIYIYIHIPKFDEWHPLSRHSQSFPLHHCIRWYVHL